MSQSLNKNISIIELCKELYLHKFSIIAVSSLFFILSIAISLSLTNRYTAKATLVGVVSDSGGLAALAKNFGGLASVAGLNLGASGGEDKSAIAIEIIKSREFINNFVLKNDLSVPLVAGERYNISTGELEIDSDIFDVKDNEWIREVKFPRTVEPSPWEIHKAFLDLLKIEQDVKTGFVTLSFEFYSPTLAKKWLELLIVEINEKIKNDDKQEAKKSIIFLNEALDNVKNSNMQQTFYQLIEEQTKTLMLTESKEEYVFKTISPAYLPERKSFPNRIVICISGGFLGAIIMSFWIISRYFYRNEH